MSFIPKTTRVFKVSAAVAGFLILTALVFPKRLYDITSTVRDFVGCHFGWFYLILATAVVGVCLYCVLSPFGRIRLGDPDSRPEHSDASWLAMLFSAGMGIGLVFSFFITSADSATVVLAMESEDGALKPKPLSKFVWGVFLSLTAIALMFAGGLDALQDMMIVFALPFAILLVLIILSLIKELHYEQREMGLYIKAKKFPSKDEPFRSYENDEE